MNDNPNGPMLLGFVSIALVLVGLGSCAGAFFAITNQETADYIGGGIFAIAAALSFGLLMNGLARK